MKWKPLTTTTNTIIPSTSTKSPSTGELPVLHSRLLQKTEEIAKQLEVDGIFSDFDNIGLLTGKTGTALFYFYYSRLTGDESHAKTGVRLIEEVFHRINEGYDNAGFSNGLAGIGWALQHLTDKGYIDIGAEDLLLELDDFFLQSMTEALDKSHYDFLQGALGIGRYWLSRLPHGQSQNAVRQLLHWIEKNAQPDSGGLMWTVTKKRENGEKQTLTDLGAAHGMTAIIAFLSSCIKQKFDGETAPPLLEKAVSYLLHQTQDIHRFDSYFPNTVPSDTASRSSRMAWCYGDPGIASVLFQASRATGNTQWYEKSIEIFQTASGRRDPRKNQVYDTCFCHGTIGLAHMFNRMYLHTGLDTFGDTALYWLKLTLNSAHFNDGLCGYKTWCGGDLWKNYPDLLNGITGIGLVFISMASNIAPMWDEAFLLS